MVPSKEEWTKALAAKQGEDVQKILSNATVAVFGLGGLGSNIAICLARAGVKKLILSDFDRVEITNLNRQQYKARQLGELKAFALAENLREIAPYVELECHAERITGENVVQIAGDASVVCEAFDRAEEKAMLVNAVLEKMPEKFLVAASGMAGFESANLIETRRVSRKFFMCGDGRSDVNDGIGLVLSRVMVCAAHQAHMVVRILTGEFDA